MYPLADLPCALPTRVIPDFLDLSAVAKHVGSLFEVLGEGNFVQDAVWRDSFAMTGTFRTFYSSSSITAAWKETSRTHKPSFFTVEGKPHLIKAGDAMWVELKFSFQTNGVPAASVDGFVSVVPDEDGKWKIWLMRTIIGQLRNQPNVDRLNKVGETLSRSYTANHVTNGVHPDEPSSNGHSQKGVIANGVITNGVGEHAHHEENKQTDFQCVVIGGGQAGLAVGGRLKALDVSYVVMDKYDNVGDSWALRYDSTRLHTVREFAHLPFERTFPDSYQEFLTKDDLAKGFREWVAKFDINVWTSTTVLSGSWLKDQGIWELQVQRGQETLTVTCSNVVLAVGANSRFPLAPTYADREAFSGTVIHSADYTSPEKWAGKHGVVIGSGNTAHDVADDMYRHGLASVTMVQRSPTFVIPVDLYRETHDRVYNAQMPTELADLIFFSGPAVMTKLMAGKMLHQKIRDNPDRFDALEKAGFLLDRYADMGYVIYVRQGGHYMDVGTSGKIASGLIKMKTDSLPVRWTESGLECSNGDHIRADFVVFATGFVGNLRLLVAELLGNDVAGQVEDYWGLDAEGELQGAFKPSGHPAFWYTGGAIGQARYMSRFIALQIKAKCLGTPLPIYSDTPPRNSSSKKLSEV